MGLAFHMLCLRQVLQTPTAPMATRFWETFSYITLKCLRIGTPKINHFPFVSNGKLMVFRCPNICTHYNEAVLSLNFGTPEKNEFSIWNKWKIYYF